jgi:hypothetical protein
MAVVANTVLTTAAVGNREELDNFVAMITPTDTPIYSFAKKGKAASKHPEWEFETLDTPGTNAQPEGAEFNFDAVAAPTRVGARTQIFTKTFTFSGTQQVVDNAGPAEKRDHEAVKKGKAIRKDMEYAILSNTASSNTDPRTLGGLPTWLTTNVSRNSGTNGGFSGSDTTAESTGTLRAWTKAQTDSVLQQVYNAGGNVTTGFVSPYNKGVFATFMSDTNVAGQRHPVQAGGKISIIGTADIYESPWGAVNIMADRVMAGSASVARRNFFLDPDFIEWLNLRPIQEVPNIAKTGDRESGVVLGEGTLKVVNEAAHGVVADVYGIDATH